MSQENKPKVIITAHSRPCAKIHSDVLIEALVHHRNKDGCYRTHSLRVQGPSEHLRLRGYLFDSPCFASSEIYTPEVNEEIEKAMRIALTEGSYGGEDARVQETRSWNAITAHFEERLCS